MVHSNLDATPKERNIMQRLNGVCALSLMLGALSLSSYGQGVANAEDPLERRTAVSQFLDLASAAYVEVRNGDNGQAAQTAQFLEQSWDAVTKGVQEIGPQGGGGVNRLGRSFLSLYMI